MCGRYTLRATVETLGRLFDVPDLPKIQPRYNIAPTQSVPVIVQEAEHEQRAIRMMHWGLIPSWSKDRKMANRLINARSETIATKPSFRSAFRRRRCLLPADGFYEWRHQPQCKQAYFIGIDDDVPFAFAGLWALWKGPDGKPVESCTILTIGANELLRNLHDRMPVILDPRSYVAWLDPAMQEADRLLPLLQPYPAQKMAFYPVSEVVNSPRYDGPRCVERVE